MRLNTSTRVRTKARPDLGQAQRPHSRGSGGTGEKPPSGTEACAEDSGPSPATGVSSESVAFSLGMGRTRCSPQ